MSNPQAIDARELVSQRRDEREQGYEVRRREWVGTATKIALDFPYNALWGFPDKFYREPPKKTGEIKGLAASPGLVEGIARNVTSLKQFNQVEAGATLGWQITIPSSRSVLYKIWDMDTSIRVIAYQQLVHSHS